MNTFATLPIPSSEASTAIKCSVFLQTFCMHFCIHIRKIMGLPWGLSSKESTYQSRGCGFNPWGGKVPWRKEMATHSSILAWKIPGTEEPDRLQSMGSQRVGHD